MEFEDPSSEIGYSGFDIELVEAIAADMGAKVEVINSGFDAIESGLVQESGDCELSAAAITITEEREENVDFTDPYFKADQSLLVPADSEFTKAEDLGKIGVASNTTGESYAKENLENELVSFENSDDMYLGLTANKVDGVITDLVANQAYVEDDKNDVKIIQKWETNEEYGFTVKEEGAEDLLEALNTSLSNVREDGTYDELFEKYFG